MMEPGGSHGDATGVAGAGQGGAAHGPWRAQLLAAFAQEQRQLWGACYRMSGCAADADDWLHDVFERALSHPPADRDRPLGPWLMRVTMNICRDQLRRRQHRAYAGPWLPGPVEEATLRGLIEARPSAEARYDQMQSVSIAFLTALEALTPNQRAVLVLRDVFDLSTHETAEQLELSEANVKTTLHRARAAMARYEQSPSARCDAAANEARRDALYAFMVHFLAGNTEALGQLLAEDVVMLNDGGGKYFAAKRPVIGRDKVLTFHRKTARLAVGVRESALPGGAAVMVNFVRGKRARLAPRGVAYCDIDDAGRITHLYYALADRKIEALPWEQAGLPSAGLLRRVVSAALRVPGVDGGAATVAARRGVRARVAQARAAAGLLRALSRQLVRR